MKCATSFFDRGVFIKSVLRFWPIWAIYAFVWMLVLPASLIDVLARAPSDAARIVLQSVEITAAWLCPLAACGAAMAVFSHMYSERSAGFFAALPVRREALFVSLCAAGLLPLLGANLLAFAAALAVEALFGATGIAALGQWLGAVTLMTLCYFGIAVLCAQLTGHLVVMPILFIVLGVVASSLGNMALVVPDMFCYGYVSNGAGIADLFSPFVCMMLKLTVEYRENEVYALNGWPYLIAYGLVGIALLPVSMALYKRRNMESAGDVVAIGPVKPAFKYICGMAAAFILGNLFYTVPFGTSPEGGAGQAIIYSICMAAGAFVGCFGADMLLNKSFGVFGRPRRYIGWGVVSLLCLAIVFTCEFDVTGYEDRVPESSEVQSVRVSAGGVTVNFYEEDSIALAIEAHESAVEAKSENESDEAYSSASATHLNIDYTLRGGGELAREYRVAYNGAADTLDILEELMNSREGIEARKSLSIPVTVNTVEEARVVFSPDALEPELVQLTVEEAMELYRDCILPDMRDGTIGIVWYRMDDDYYNSVYDCRIEIDLKRSYNLPVSDSFYTVPTIWSERTNEWLTEHGIELKTLAESGEAA